MTQLAKVWETAAVVAQKFDIHKSKLVNEREGMSKLQLAVHE